MAVRRLLAKPSVTHQAGQPRKTRKTRKMNSLAEVSSEAVGLNLIRPAIELVTKSLAFRVFRVFRG
jgi:hypothetical protein